MLKHLDGYLYFGVVTGMDDYSKMAGSKHGRWLGEVVSTGQTSIIPFVRASLTFIMSCITCSLFLQMETHYLDLVMYLRGIDGLHSHLTLREDSGSGWTYPTLLDCVISYWRDDTSVACLLYLRVIKYITLYVFKCVPRPSSCHHCTDLPF